MWSQLESQWRREGKILFVFYKITLIKGQTFRAYFYENGGNRNFKVEFRGRDLR